MSSSSSSGSEKWCGRCIILFFCLLGVFTVWVFLSVDYIQLLESDELELNDPPLVLENDRLPMISSDKRSIYVVSEQGLPIAHNFILRNPSIPIEKIVYRKPGLNSSIHVYPIQRDALFATNRGNLSQTDISGICAFIFMLFFTAVGLYFLMCRIMCYRCCFPNRSSSHSHDHRHSADNDSPLLCEICFEFDPNLDLGDLEEFLETPDSSPCNSPIKIKKDKQKSSYGKDIPIMDELKKPLLMTV